MALEISVADMLVRVALFVLVQALVYLILSKSSNVFSKNKRLDSFKPARSVSVRRILASLSDFPPGGEASPSRMGSPSPTQEYRKTNDQKCN
ncbi:hypothetical protein L1049_018967 [Liquidambar formosana]|uniref:Uncharacterized protein n=1 Tax=Liquidambar formosana TaxID=63359 RepID=A0AAP0RCJ5_LIQFO